MPIKKVVAYEVQCDGPCRRLFGVDRPGAFSYVKIEPANKKIGVPLEYLVGVVCPDCRAKVEDMLKHAGFKLNSTSANEQKK